MITYDKVLDALADRTRRSIVELLRTGPKRVGELSAALPVSQPAVSQHLRVLREAGLVESRREGTRRIYRLRPEGLNALRDYAASFWSSVLDHFKGEQHA
ncbi:MAG TPA: metalloregulator ArsR/SmtB family transcription factor [Gemmatimonadales bacterium]